MTEEELVRVILANDGGTCHGFGQVHCFNDPTAKWDGRRCNECKDWAGRLLGSIEEPIRADEAQRLELLAAGAIIDVNEDGTISLAARADPHGLGWAPINTQTLQHFVNAVNDNLTLQGMLTGRADPDRAAMIQRLEGYMRQDAIASLYAEVQALPELDHEARIAVLALLDEAQR